MLSDGRLPLAGRRDRRNTSHQGFCLKRPGDLIVSVQSDFPHGRSAGLAVGSTSDVTGGQREHFRCHSWPTGALKVSQVASWPTSGVTAGQRLPAASVVSVLGRREHATFALNTALCAAQAR